MRVGTAHPHLWRRSPGLASSTHSHGPGSVTSPRNCSPRQQTLRPSAPTFSTNMGGGISGYRAEPASGCGQRPSPVFLPASLRCSSSALAA